MHTNYHFLKHYIPYLNSRLLGAKLIACFSQDKDVLILTFLKETEELHLKIGLKNNENSLILLSEFTRAKKNTTDLWTDLYGLKIENIDIFLNERAFTLQLENGYDFVIKFFQNSPNLLIYKDKEVQFLFNNKLTADKEIQFESFNRALEFNKKIFYENDGKMRAILPTLGKLVNTYIEINTENKSLEESYDFCKKTLSQLEEPVFYIIEYNEKVNLSLVPLGDVLEKLESPQAALEAYFHKYWTISIFKEKQNTLLKDLEKQIQKTKTYIFDKENSLYELNNQASYEEVGHIIMANLQLISEDLESVELLNFYTQENLKIKLKKNLTPSKNAEWYYKKSKNEKITRENLEDNLAAARKNLEKFETTLLAISEVSDNRALNPFVKAVDKAKNAEINEDELFKKFEVDGYEILVGKNAKNNDLLTLKHARKDDYWFHAKDVSGSHVVVKKKNGQNIAENIAEYAASLAAHFSKRKTDSVVPVIFTQKKFVRKTKNLPDGKVIVDKERILLVKPAIL
jgi:predicted ribosome quality control (RQC) complex YloA/Tae2 family protein